jgi:hypothetical protein
MKKLILPISVCLILLISLAAPALGAGGGPAAPERSEPLNGGNGVSLLEAGLALPAPVEVRYDPNPIPVHVDAPERGLTPEGMLAPQSASFVIRYTENATNALSDSCGSFPAAAKPAMEAAVAIWANLLNSSVPIRVEVCFASLPAYVLGHSATLMFYRDFSGAAVAGTWYPIALGNALHGSDLNTSYDDISIAYATDYESDFYFGTDGHPGSGQIDFESVILHEIGHGLGFAGSMRGDSASHTARWGLSSPAYPVAYDRFTVNNANNLLISSYAGYTWLSGLYTDLTSGNVYFTGANAKAANGGNRVPLYAPATWASGSSYAHLAESFNGTVNAMMTYSIGDGESIHAPGPVTMGVLKDVGWSTNVVTVATPTGLVVTPASSTQINLSWTDNGAGETGFKIERSVGDTSHWDVLTTTATPDTTYSDTTVTPGTRNYYRISAVYPGPQYSSASSVQNTITPLNLPGGLTVTATSTSQVALAWTDSNPTETGYKIERSPNGTGSWTAVTTTAANVQAYTNTGLTEGTKYFYRVWAANSLGTAANSPYATGNATTPLVAPTGLTATVISTSQVNLAWAQTSTHETGYAVNRGPSASGPWTLIYTATANAVTYNDTAAVEGSAYYYSVTAVNTVPAASLPAVTAAAAIVPLLPPGGVGAAMGPVGQVIVSWTDASAHESGYRVERSATGGAPWTNATPDLLPAGAASFNDTGMPELSSVTYRVTAVNAATSAQSAPVTSGAVTTPLAAPAAVMAAPLLAGGQIQIQWTDASTHETGYELEYATSSGGPWTALTITAANVHSFLWVQPVNDTYFFRIRTIDATPAHASAYILTSAVLDTNWVFVAAVRK